MSSVVRPRNVRRITISGGVSPIWSILRWFLGAMIAAGILAAIIVPVAYSVHKHENHNMNMTMELGNLTSDLYCENNATISADPYWSRTGHWKAFAIEAR